MTPFLQLAFVLVIILFMAKIAGYFSTRMGQPSVLGELLIGLILGPSLIDLTHLGVITDTHLQEVVFELGEIGVLLLMFLAGLELNISDLTKNSRVSAYAGVLGVLVPVGLGWLVGSLMDMPSSNALFLGLTLGATSVSISAQTLIELKVLRSRVGLGLLGAAVFDDVLVILLLSGFLALASGQGGAADIAIVFLRMLLFLGVSVTFGLYLLPVIVRKISRLPISFGVVTLSIITLFTYGLAAELIGEMAAITGTFIAGLMFGRTSAKNEIESGIRTLSYSFFVPIFFVTIGLNVDLHNIELSVFGLLLLISSVGILGKIIGAGIGARIGRYSWRESLQLGIGMVSRGEVGLIVAQVGLTSQYITQEVFSAVVGMVLITTLVTPPMLRASFSSPKKTTS